VNRSELDQLSINTIRSLAVDVVQNANAQAKLGLPPQVQAVLFDLDGVDRLGQAAALRRHGADVVVQDLAALLKAA
jgi:hypothetical protein